MSTMTVHEWIESAKSRLLSVGVEAPSLEAQLLAAHVLLVDRPWLMAHPEEPFPDLAGERVLASRLAQEPLAYILGKREFYGRSFSVRPSVLIPRQETELLVESALKWIKPRAGLNPKVLDLGTGSGCIAVSLKLEMPTWDIFASDISTRAIEIASENADALGAELTLVESDLFANFNDDVFDAIVSNPPYVGTDEMLAIEVKDHEPFEALFSGKTGREFYERLSRESHLHMIPHGLMLMEVGYRQAIEVSELFKTAGWTVVDVVNDLSGTPRVVICTN